MKFNNIRFQNYRCFINGELNFSQDGNQNINLVLGKNGAGKTELLFAFWWVLYGFNFSTLKNKEVAPFALNISRYRALETGMSNKEECVVTLELEHEGKVFIVERKEEYRRTPKKVLSEEYQSIRYYKQNHELSLPIRDDNEVKKILNRIIPKSILFGIIFDGERMKQLSSVDENAVKAIGGVISDITNVELVELCILAYQKMQSMINKKSKNLARLGGQKALEEIIDNLEGKIEEHRMSKKRLEVAEEELEDLKMKEKELSGALSNIAETKHLEEQRKDQKANLEREEKRKENILKNYMDSLKDGQILICETLFEEVKRLLVEYDVPVGLTVEAVVNLLKRTKCICGTVWTEDMISEIEKLKETLPPDNINSLIGEMVRNLEIYSEKVRSGITKDFNTLEECKSAIENIKGSIASLSSQILGSGSEDAEIVENEYNACQKKVWLLEQEIENLRNSIPKILDEIETKKKLQSTMSQHKGEWGHIEKEIEYIDKCIVALERISEINKMVALNRINERLADIYGKLCDDANYGRQIYIVQYNRQYQYRLITYYQEDLEKTLSNLKASHEYKEFLESGMPEEEIVEYAIIQCGQPNSTGQSKMNTLAFVKAILDYSNEKRNFDSLEITKEYPLLIDAPFGDIFDENLENSAKLLNSFTHQIILMLAQESYESVADHIGPHISTVHTLEIQHESTNSLIIAK